MSPSPAMPSSSPSSLPPIMVPRNQRQIRARFYHKLGLLDPPQLPQDTGSTGSTTSSHQGQGEEQPHVHVPPPPPPVPLILRSCLRKPSKQPPRSVLHTPEAEAAMAAAAAATKNKSVHFYLEVEVVFIPSHRDYDAETKALLWNPSHVINAEMQRNMFEFWADGGDWQTATEEVDMISLPDGTFVHPATWNRMRAFQPKPYYDYGHDVVEALQPPSTATPPPDNTYLHYSYPQTYLPSYRPNLQQRRQKSWEKTTNQNKRSNTTNTRSRSSSSSTSRRSREDANIIVPNHKDHDDHVTTTTTNTEEVGYPYYPHLKDMATLL